MDIPVYAQGILTVEDLVQDSFEGKIGQFTRKQQKELKGLRRKFGYAQLYGFGHQECI